jgi:protein SCO1/2
MKHSRSTFISVMLALFLMGCADDQPIVLDLPYYNDATLTPEWGRPDHTVSPFVLTNQDGQVVTNHDVDGRIYVASFFYVHCTSICPSLRTNLAAVQQVYGSDDDVLILSHTITPEVDTVPVLKIYAKVNDVRTDTWHLLTGSHDDIYSLARDAYFIDLEFDQQGGFTHSETFVLVDGTGHVRGVYTGTLEFEVNQLIEDIAELKRVTV